MRKRIQCALKIHAYIALQALCSVYVHIVQLHGREYLRQALPELIKLLLLHGKITAQPGSIFATGECVPAEVDHSLR